MSKKALSMRHLGRNGERVLVGALLTVGVLLFISTMGPSLFG